MTASERAELYRNFLAEEGYAARIDDDGNVVFKYHAMTFFISADEDDEEFFRLVCPNFWSIDSDEERDHVVHAAAAVNSSIKVAKVYPVRDSTWASVEMYCSPPDAVLPVLLRAMGTLRGMVTEFRRAVHEES